MSNERTTQPESFDENAYLSRVVVGCGGIIGLLASSFLLGLLLFAFFGCTSSRQAILTEGTIMDRDGNLFLTTWKDAGGKPNTYAVIWIYKEGLGLVPVKDLEIEIVIKQKSNGNTVSDLPRLDGIRWGDFSGMYDSLSTSYQKTLQR